MECTWLRFETAQYSCLPYIAAFKQTIVFTRAYVFHTVRRDKLSELHSFAHRSSGYISMA
jgi:hypothetical protein